MINSLIKKFETRKDNLINILQEKPNGLDPGKAHQMYGAILEIDLMIKTLKHYNTESLKNKLNNRNGNQNFK